MRQFLVCLVAMCACATWPSTAGAARPDSGTAALRGSVSGTCTTTSADSRPRPLDSSSENTPSWRPAAAVAPQPAIGIAGSPDPAEDEAVISDSKIDGALNEMLRGRSGVLRWFQVPELVILTSVMEYESGTRSQYHATSERLRDEDAEGLIADLTAALGLLTDNTFTEFAAVHLESVPPGTRTSVVRPGQIVVGRYRGVRDQLDTIGLGGRFGPGGGTISGGSIVLDSDFDRSSTMRHLLRTHELGHALGYNHVASLPSIMNPRIGPEPTDFDRRAAHLAFRGDPSVTTTRCPNP